MCTLRKTIKLRRLVYLVTLLLIAGVYARGEDYVQDSTRKKEFNKSFSVNSSDKLYISNEFGNITVTHWNKKEVAIHVVIEASARTSKRAEELLGYANVELDKQGNTVKGETSRKNFSGTNNNEQLNVNYFIRMPASMEQVLELKFGNIYLPDRIDGKTHVELKFGNLKAGDFTKDLHLEAEYSNVTLGDVTKGDLELAFCGSVKIGDVNQLHLESKYSNVIVKKIKKLHLENSFGDITVDELTEGYMEIKYGKGKLGTLRKSLTVDKLEFGSLDIKDVAPDFIKIEVESNYGNLGLGIPVKTAFDVEVEKIKYGKYIIDGFNVQTNKEENRGEVSYRSSVNNGNRQRRVYYHAGGFGNLTIKAR